MPTSASSAASAPQPVYLADYRVPPFLIDTTSLRFELEADQTRVVAVLELHRNPDADGSERDLVLHGDPSLVLERLALDGRDLVEAEYLREEETLTLKGVPERFRLECETLINPAANTSLEGLYLSNGMFCTQCEAEGFRKITFFLDRPDVMSRYTTTLVADPDSYPVLLSNGNPVGQGRLEDGRHWQTWEDPFRKPSYLFALVAGDLECVSDRFVTCSGREIDLRLYVEKPNLDKCGHALRSLKHAMRWDEEVYGREYDLDIFMIVAVDHFNMGAMENKGLNIFNSSCVLAKPETTTDAAFQRVEGVVAHEYFHNWSGNRVTCRDWFQLSLKEGFTVFRDAEFSADMGSRVVKRIEDVNLLRTVQFAEDAGPMAHPVRPASFIEISNFYTLTVYEKGAEVVRMLHTLLGPDAFRRGCDLYFERHDGQAVTTDDFVAAMEAVSGLDLTQFKRWYEQAGTPRLTVRDRYDAERGLYQLTVSQHCPATPGQSEKLPFHLPLSIGLLDSEGRDLALEAGQTTQVLHLREAEQVFEFSGLAERPVPSLLRGFSAPVKIDYPYSRETLCFLMSHDSDGFNRWEAGQKLAIAVLQEQIDALQAGCEHPLDPLLVEAMERVLADSSLDPALVAKMLELPSEAYLSELADLVDVDAIHGARERVRRALAQHLRPALLARYQQLASTEPYQPDAEGIGRRTLRNRCLNYLASLETPEAISLVEAQYRTADNMTDRLAALTLLVHSTQAEKGADALDDFYQTWKSDSLVVNQWLSVQASAPLPGTLAQVRELMQHEAFERTNPNRVRALIGVFCGQNPVCFHQADGEGYRFLAGEVMTFDRLNPQIAARLLTPLTRWGKYDVGRQGLMKQALENIRDSGKLSKDVYEVVSKSLA